MIAICWPLLCLLHIIFPRTVAGQWLCRPFMKFIVGTASYLTFLMLLVLASQIKGHPSGDDPGPEPSAIEWLLLPWIIALIAGEVGQLWSGGAADYIKAGYSILYFL